MDNWHDFCKIRNQGVGQSNATTFKAERMDTIYYGQNNKETLSRHELKKRILDIVQDVMENGGSLQKDVDLDAACLRLEKEYPTSFSAVTTTSTVERLVKETNAEDRMWDIYVEWYSMRAQAIDLTNGKGKLPPVVQMTGKEIEPWEVLKTDRLPQVHGIGVGVYVPKYRKMMCMFGMGRRDAEAWLLENNYSFIKREPDGEQLWALAPHST